MTDKMRAEFEEWAKSIPLANLNRHLDGYENSSINSYWAVWQASRAALAVDVSSLPSASYTDSGVVYRNHIETELDAAGISYK